MHYYRDITFYYDKLDLIYQDVDFSLSHRLTMRKHAH